MIEGIIGLVSCLMCAVPFIIISVYNKDSREPISFWSGDTTLRTKVKNVSEYNKGMAKLYKRCAIALMIPLELSLKEISILSAMILLSHTLPVEMNYLLLEHH